MRKLLFALLYVGALGLLSNLVAWALPRRFRPEAFPFRPYGFENQGKLYEKLGIRRWKNKVPDMSRILAMLPTKKIALDAKPVDIQTQIQESCMAEAVHLSLMFLSLFLLTFWRDIWAAAFLILYNLLGNVPYILIQRYNRPRFLRLAKRIREKGGRSC